MSLYIYIYNIPPHPTLPHPQEDRKVLKARVFIGGVSTNKEVKDTNLPRKSHCGSWKKEIFLYPRNSTVFFLQKWWGLPWDLGDVPIIFRDRTQIITLLYSTCHPHAIYHNIDDCPIYIHLLDNFPTMWTIISFLCIDDVLMISHKQYSNCPWILKHVFCPAKFLVTRFTHIKSGGFP